LSAQLLSLWQPFAHGSDVTGLAQYWPAGHVFVPLEPLQSVMPVRPGLPHVLPELPELLLGDPELLLVDPELPLALPELLLQAARMVTRDASQKAHLVESARFAPAPVLSESVIAASVKTIRCCTAPRGTRIPRKETKEVAQVDRTRRQRRPTISTCRFDCNE
jgi:hypothetical protein